MLTEEQKQHLIRLKNEGKTFSEAMGLIGAAKVGAIKVPPPSPSIDLIQRMETVLQNPPQVQQTMLPRKVGESEQDIQQTFQGIGNAIQKRTQQFSDVNTPNVGSNLLQREAAVLGGAADVAGELFKGGVKLVLNADEETRLKQGVSQAIQSFTSIPAVKSFLESTDEQRQRLKDSNPEAYKDLAAMGDVFNGLLTVSGAAPATRGASQILGKVDEGLTTVSQQIASKTPQIASQAMETAGKVGTDIATKAGQIRLPKLTGIQSKPRIDVDVDEQVFNQIKARGFDEKDAILISSLSEADKAAAKNMFELAEQATKNPRAVSRPIDIVGKNAVTKIGGLETKLRELGKGVGEASKSLKGQKVDAQALTKYVQDTMAELGVKVTQTKNGIKYDFTDTPFARIKTAQTQLANAFADAQKVGTNPEKLHNLKLSIDEVVSYGKQAEGLSGNGERILKGIRNKADEILDTNFDSYRIANDQYKEVRGALEGVQDAFGETVNAERAASVIRRVYSNAASRGDIKSAISTLDEVGAKYGVATKDNLLDQALFAEVLENLYGTQAVTSLQGEVTKGIQTAAKVAGSIRNPMNMAGDVAEFAVEKVMRQTDADKVKLLQQLFNVADEVPTKKPSTKGGFIGTQDDALTSSIQKAKASGQTFDEWVKQEIKKEPTVTVYRGSKTGTRHENIKDFTFFATNKEYAKQYMKKGEKLVEYKLPETALLRDKINSQEVQYLVDIRNPKIARLEAEWNKVSNTSDALFQEARKYKTAEEFVKAQGDTLYHGSPKDNITEVLPGGLTGRQGEKTVPGISVTDDYNTASYYARRNGVQVNSPIEVNVQGKILQADSLQELQQKLGVSDWSDSTRSKIPKLLSENGYVGFRIKGSGDIGEVVVTNPSAIKTKSQLEDIWKQANETKNKKGATARDVLLGGSAVGGAAAIGANKK